MLDCLEAFPQLDTAIASRQPDRILETARSVDAIHSYSRTYKNYRYHVDICKISDLARIEAGNILFPSSRAEAWAALGDREEAEADLAEVPWLTARTRRPECLGFWLALQYQAGQLPEVDGFDECYREWRDRRNDPEWAEYYGDSVRESPAWIIRAIVEAGTTGIAAPD